MRGLGPAAGILAACLLLLMPLTAHAQPGPRQTALCAGAILQAERKHDTPPGLLVTIAKVESGRRNAEGKLEPWPWTINADGQGYFFATKAEAIAWARQGLANGVRFMDVGCMQVDLQMHPNAFRSLDDAFDPAINADYAARFLRSLHDGADDNWYAAIGFYHSRTPELASYYRLAVAAVGAGLPIPGGPRVGRAGITRVALTGGGATLLNLHRQPARIRRTISPCRIAAVLGSYLRSPPVGCKRS
ncbi:MAG: transglycosylase SLT domain-containing protein [Alphaproteobacteria bacterium]|nr:transglycosylase SLT domain-containing protein [Alphaproteobacteria bacterium]